MTIRTARLPGAGNLFGQAGEDLSGLPDRASCYQFLSYFIDSIIYFNSSTRLRVTVAVFVLQFHNRNISFLSHHHQTDRLQCRSMRLACQCSQANQKLALFTRGEAWLALSFGVSFLKGASEEEGWGR